MKTFSKILIVPILLLIGVSGIKATERLYIEEFNISPGNSRSVGIELSNSGVYTGFQADIELPEGLNLTLQNGEAEVNLSSRADASHMLVSNRLADGTWRIVCFSSENVPFSGTEGELLTIRLKSDAQFAGGSVTIKNILFTNTNNQDVAFLENTTQIGITEENSLSTEPLTIENEGEYPVTINLKNDTEFSAFQFDIILPEELSVVENTLALTSRLSASHNLTQTIDGNKIRVLAISVSNAPITGSKGGILTFNVKAEKNIVAQGEMKLQNILFSTANANEYILENSTVAVSINVPLTLYTISVSSSDESMGSTTASETEVEEGATVTLTATPKDGYKFTNWTLGGEVVSTDNPYQATITANSEFVANFEALPTSGKFEAVNSDGVTIWYNITSYNTAEVTYKGSSYDEYSREYSGEVNIPSTVEYSGNTYSVTSIGDNAFYFCTGLTSVTIPESVTSIGDEAFYHCEYLTSVTIPESVTSIGRYAFSDCYGLTSVTIPEGVTSIGEYAFFNCDGLTSVTIPESVTSIGYGAFYNCNRLTEIEVAENNTNYSSEEGVLFNKDKTELIQYPIGNSRTSYSIPEGVTTIGHSAFWDCTGLTSVTIPEGVTSIGSHAFYNCEYLTSVTIPEGVTSIGSSAFSGCTGLTSVIIPESVTSIGYYAFYNCTGLTSVTIPEGVTSIGDYAFLGCEGLTEIYSLNPVAPDITSTTFGHVSKTIPVYIPKGSLSSYQSAEYWSEFTNFVEIKEIYTISVSSSDEGMGSATSSETEVEEGATVTLTATPKDGYKFTNWTLGGEVVSTDNPYQATITANSEFVANFEALPTSGKFEAVNSDGVTIWYNITSYNTAEVTYKGSSYSEYSGEYSGEVNIPSTVEYSGNTYSVTAIGDDAFYKCDGLTSVTIPESVTSIGSYAFYYCTGLTSVTIPEGVTTIGDWAFEGCDGLTSVTISEGVTSIGEYAFRFCSGLTSVTIPESVTSIGSYAFRSCSGLTGIEVAENNTNYSSEEGVLFNKDKTKLIQYPIGNSRISYSIPEGVTTIGNSAFRGCSGLTSVVIPEGVTSIGSSAFWDCTGLTSVTIPEGVTSIGSYAFEYCSGLTSVTIPNSVTTIEDRAFRSCSGLTSVVIPEGVTTIGDWAFDNCYGLTSVTIPESVTSIGSYAFLYCTGLTSVTIPNSVTAIGDYAFFECYGLTEIEVAENNTNYSSEEGVLFNKDKTKLIQYPIGNSRTSYSIPEGVTSIGNYAFDGCTGLTSVTIPESVTSIGDDAFRDCTGLTEIYSLNPVAPTIDSQAFDYVPKTIPVYIPKGSLSSYQSAEYWSEFTNFVEIKEIYTISVSSSDEGMGSATSSETEVEEGATVTLTATPKDGYKFTNWTLGGEVVSTDNPYQATITANSEFVANFEELKDKEVIEDEVTNKDENLGNVEIAPEENKDVILDINTYIFKAENITINVDKEGNSPQIQISIGGEVVSKKIEVVRNVKGGIWDMLSLPFDVNISDITVEGVPAEIGVNILLQYYDGAFRAEHSIEGETANAWKAISSGIIPANQGFAIAINSRYDGDVQEVSFSGNDFAMDSEEKELTLKRHESSVNKGMDADWNFLGNPTLSNQAKESGYSLYLYNTESDSYTEYSSSMAATIKPFSAWFVQSAQDFMSMIFGTRPKAMKSAEDTVEGTLSLNINGDDDATIIINPEATEGYQRNEDALYMASPNGNLSQLYIINDGVEMAVSEQPEEASTIAIGYKAVKAGEQTLTLTSVPDGTEVTLTDNHTGTVTQMSLGDSYNFESAAGTYKNRFSLNMTDMTSIGQTEITGSIKAVVTNDEVKLYGTTEGAEITLYTANGMLITQAMAEEGITTIPTAASGVIIIKVGTETIKAVK